MVCAQSAACVLRTDSPAQAELQQILDVLEGDEISLDDLASAFLVYKVSPDSEDIEVVLRDYTDGEWGSRVLAARPLLCLARVDYEPFMFSLKQITLPR